MRLAKQSICFQSYICVCFVSVSVFVVFNLTALLRSSAAPAASPSAFVLLARMAWRIFLHLICILRTLLSLS